MAIKDRGFASMKDRARQREIARSGGKAAHRAGTAHRWTSEQARIAGRKGGLVSKKGRALPVADPLADVPLPFFDVSNLPTSEPTAEPE